MATTKGDLEAIVAALGSHFNEASVAQHGETIERIEELGRIEGAQRYTFRYEAEPQNPSRRVPFAIECVHAWVGGVRFERNLERPLVEGESRESDYRPQRERDEERERLRIAAEEAARAVVITPPRPVVCTESRWSYLEID
jgi:hypothetical protein